MLDNQEFINFDEALVFVEKQKKKDKKLNIEYEDEEIEREEREPFID